MIRVSNLSFRYGKQQILNNVSFDIPQGAVTAILGLNGAGKSTLLKCLAKLNPVPKQSIFVNNEDITAYTHREYAKLVSVVPQLTSAVKISMPVVDFLVGGRTPYLPLFAVPGKKEYELAEKTAADIGITELLTNDFSTLSGGQQQLVYLARTLVQDTQYVILDEPMSALDLMNQQKLLSVLNTLSRSGKTIVFSTHNPNHPLALNSNVILLKNGCLLDAGLANDRLTDDVIHELYGDAVKMVCREDDRVCQLHKPC